MLKPNKKEKELHIYFNEESSKFKIEIKAIPENSLLVRRDVDKGKFRSIIQGSCSSSSRRLKRRNLSRKKATHK